jgi:hypothetical protein
MRALEAALGSVGGADVPLVVDVHIDETSGEALEEATGPIEELWIAMREPATHKEWLAVGASVPHLETTEAIQLRLTDGAWGTRLLDQEPPPEPIERPYFVDSR